MSGCVTVTGPPSLDLLLELRHHRAVRGEHIAEAHRDQAHRRAAVAARKIGVERLAVHFGKALGRAEHRHRLDRLVGRDHHHGGGAGRRCRVRDVHRAEHIGLDALAPVALEQRHVLERRRVEHDVRLEVGEDRHDALAVANIGDAPVDLARSRPWRAAPRPRCAARPRSARPPAIAPRRTRSCDRRFPRRSSRRRRSR